jgi:hypothetical protein
VCRALFEDVDVRREFELGEELLVAVDVDATSESNCHREPLLCPSLQSRRVYRYDQYDLVE